MEDPAPTPGAEPQTKPTLVPQLSPAPEIGLYPNTPAPASDPAHSKIAISQPLKWIYIQWGHLNSDLAPAPVQNLQLQRQDLHQLHPLLWGYHYKYDKVTIISDPSGSSNYAENVSTILRNQRIYVNGKLSAEDIVTLHNPTKPHPSEAFINPIGIDALHDGDDISNRGKNGRRRGAATTGVPSKGDLVELEPELVDTVEQTDFDRNDSEDETLFHSIQQIKIMPVLFVISILNHFIACIAIYCMFIKTTRIFWRMN